MTEMTDRWARITDTFGDTLELTPEARTAFLSDLETRDPALAAEVRALLVEHDRPGEFLPTLPVPEPPADDLCGRTLGAYRLVRLLGHGGMGSVYLAERDDGAFDKQVAVKLLSPAFAQARERFRRERQMLAQLDHVNIARLLDGGTTEDGCPYLVMEYVEGVAIDRYCRERAISFDARLRLLLQVCAGVAHAHQRLIIHCDIKPENILVTADGTAKLLDFGIATLLDLTGGVTQNRPATPTYSSPEQIQGLPMTTATDVYSIGVLAYVVLTDHWPYSLRSPSPIEAVQAVLTTEPAAASRLSGLAPSLARRLRGDVETILLRAVAKDAGRRYGSVQQIADDLDAHLRGLPVKARPDTVGYRLHRLVRRHRFAAAALAVSVVSLSGAAILSTLQARAADRRFAALREFSRAIVFDVNDSLAPIAGTTAARKQLVETALRYLDQLSRDRGNDAAIDEEVAAAYIRVGKVQGGAFLPNLGDTMGAVASFEKAVHTIARAPSNAALERLRIEAHINIALLATDPIRGMPDFDSAILAGERQLERNPQDLAVLRLVAQALHGKATVAHVTDDAPTHERMAARAAEYRERIRTLATGQWQDEIDLARAYAQQGLADLQRSDLPAALARLARGLAVLESTRAGQPGNQLVIRGLAENLSRTGHVRLLLGQAGEAALDLERALALLQPLVAADTHNQQYKADLAYAWLRMGDVRRAQGRLPEAIALHRRALDARRERATRDRAFMFVPWELTRSLNTVGELLLEESPDHWPEAERLFSEAHTVAAQTLDAAPSFNQVRRQLAISGEGLARVTRLKPGADPAVSTKYLEQSAATWTRVFAQAVGDERERDRFERVTALLRSVGGTR